MLTYSFYEDCLNTMKKQGYTFESFASKNYDERYRIYLRHDVDIDFMGAYDLAKIEGENNVSSIFFFQPNNDFYNIMSDECLSIIKKIYDLGHEIGLHIDETLFKGEKEMIQNIKNTFEFYSNYIPVSNVISFHCPSSYILNNNIRIEGFINTYEKRFFEDIKYFSDSNRRIFWKDDFYNSIKEGLSIQFLTHPFWWGHFEQSMYDVYGNFSKKMNLYMDRSLKRSKGSISKLIKWLDQDRD